MRLIPILLVLAWPGAAAAQGSGADCSISVGGMEFNVYDAFASQPNRVVGHVNVQCQTSSPTEVHLSPGQSGDFQNRAMVSGESRLAYNLYVDSAEQRIAGDGASGTSPLRGRQSRRVGASSAYNIYGKIFPGQLVATGDYVDVLHLTVIF